MNFGLVNIIKDNYRFIFTVSIFLFILIFTYQINYLLFHTIIELQSIVIAFTAFIITWNAKKFINNPFLLFIGITYFFIGVLDLLHTFTFEGVGILSSENYVSNQIWISTRFLEAGSLLIGFYFLKTNKKLNADYVFLSYFIITTIILLSIFKWEIFPTCYIKGYGQTKFKIYSEFVIIAILLMALYVFSRHKKRFEPFILRLILFSILFTILSEICFSMYKIQSGIIHAAGHLFKVISFYLLYKANVETSFSKPTALLFKDIKDSELKYKTLADNLPVLLYRFDKEYNCTYFNKSKLHNNQVKLLDILFNKIIEELKYFTDQQNILRKPISILIDTHKYYFEIDIIRENAILEDIELSYLVLCQDITLIKEVENELRELNSTKDKLFSIIAHDLKNPFTAIISASQMIIKNANQLSKEKIQNLATNTYQTAKSAHILLENLLSWSRVQTGSLNPNFVDINLEVFLLEISKDAELAASAKNISIEIDNNVSANFRADLNMLKTIFRNLISNAIKFSFPNEKIILKVTEYMDNYEFRVIDFGVGIAEENIKNIFKSHNYIRTGTAQEKGTGLGLQLCKDFVRLHHGKIWIESKLDQGSTFIFTIPNKFQIKS